MYFCPFSRMQLNPHAFPLQSQRGVWLNSIGMLLSWVRLLVYINTQLNLSVGTASKVTAKGQSGWSKRAFCGIKTIQRWAPWAVYAPVPRGALRGKGFLGEAARKGEPLCIAPDAQGDWKPSLFVDTARQPLAVCHARGRGRLLDNTQGSYGFQEQHCLLQQILNGLHVCASELVCVHGCVQST